MGTVRDRFFFLFILFFLRLPFPHFPVFFPPPPFYSRYWVDFLSWFRLKSDGALEKSPVDAIRPGTHGPPLLFFSIFPLQLTGTIWYYAPAYSVLWYGVLRTIMSVGLRGYVAP